MFTLHYTQSFALSLGYLKVGIDELKPVELLEASLRKISEDPINNLKMGTYETPGNKIKKISDDLLQLTATGSFKELSADVVHSLYRFIDKYGLQTTKCQKQFWIHIHKYITSKSSKYLLVKILLENKININGSVISTIFQGIVMDVINRILKLHNQHQIPEMTSNTELKLSEDEQQIIYYVAGFIIFSMKKKYTHLKKVKSCQDAAVASLQLFDSFMTSAVSRASTFLDFTHKWVETINRGGLIEVNDQFFLFIRNIEVEVQKYLNLALLKRYSGEDIREVLQKKLEENSLIEHYWESLTRYMPNDDLKKTLKKQIIMKWIDIRARAFVQSFVQIVKRKASMKQGATKTTVSQITEPAMRKTLT